MFAAGADLDGLKSWMSFSTPRCRMAYERHARTHWPRYAMVGMSNEDDALPDDPTGNRRFAPIEVTGSADRTPQDVCAWWAENRARVWATAYRDVAAFRTLIHPTPALREMQKQVAGWHSYLDEDVAMMRDWLTAARPERIKARDAAARAGLPADRVTEGRYDKKAARALRSLGYKKQRTTTERFWTMTPMTPKKEAHDVRKLFEGNQNADSTEPKSSVISVIEPGAAADDGEPF